MIGNRNFSSFLRKLLFVDFNFSLMQLRRVNETSRYETPSGYFPLRNNDEKL